MIFHRLGLINKNQQGFTLLELLLALGISGIIVGGIAMSVFQVFNVNALSSNHMVAIRQVQNAGYWISHDAQMAQIIKLDDPATPVNEFLTLTWTDWDGAEHRVAYTLEDMTGGPKQQLERSHSNATTETSIIAQFIDRDSELTKCELTDGVLTFTVTASVGDGSQEASETREYEVIPRPGM